MDIVLITVGPEKAKHYVHSHRLCEESGFFRAAINAGFRESSEQVIDLPEDKAGNVNNFIGWLYRERLPEICAEALEDLVQRKNYLGSEVDRLCYLYIFADKYDIPRLKKCVVVDLVKMAGTCAAPGSAMIANYYKATGRKSSLRRLLCDWYTLRVGPKFFGSDRSQEGYIQNPEWAADLLAACARNWHSPSDIEAGTIKAGTIMRPNDYL